MRGANLTGVDLRRTTLTGARLSGAILAMVNLDSSCLAGADLLGADLRQANLIAVSGADFTGAILE